MYRVEDKFSCSEVEMLLLKARLQSVMDTDTNQKNKDGYRITSVYFDDYRDTCLQSSLNGVRDRCKYRIRIYDAKIPYTVKVGESLYAGENVATYCATSPASIAYSELAKEVLGCE